MTKQTVALGSLAAALLCATPSQAAIHWYTQADGTAAAPTSIGGYALTTFANDTRDTLTDVNDVASPLIQGGAVTFSDSVMHAKIAEGWESWSHGYQGDVYATYGQNLVINLPANTVAFAFYAQHNTQDYDASIGATAFPNSNPHPAGDFSPDVNGNGGAYLFAAYADPGETISHIVLNTGDASFAVGEFAMAAVPEPGTYGALAGLAVLLAAGWPSIRRQFIG